MDGVHVNLWAVLVAAAAYIAVGMAWYSTSLFGVPWMRLVGITAEDVEREYTPWVMVASMLQALAVSFVLALFISWVGADSLLRGLFVGALLGVGISAATRLPHYLYEGRPFGLFLITSSHDVVGMMLMGAILGLWQ